MLSMLMSCPESMYFSPATPFLQAIMWPKATSRTSIKSNAPARLRETVQSNPLDVLNATRTQNKDFELNQTRNEIRFMNNQMSI